MRRSDLKSFSLAQEAVVVPELGGDGAVLVKGASFGQRVRIATDTGKADQASALLAVCVRNQDGEPLLTEEGWDAFGYAHQEQYVSLLLIAKRVSGFDGDDAKKD